MAKMPNINQNIKPSSLGFGYVVGTTDGDGDFDTDQPGQK